MNVDEQTENCKNTLFNEINKATMLLNALEQLKPLIKGFNEFYSVSRGYACNSCSIDIDGITRETLPLLLQHLSAGKWDKELATSTTISYINKTLLPVPLRIWGVPPPDTCKVIEIEEQVPATPARTIKRFKVVCHDEPSLPSEDSAV